MADPVLAISAATSLGRNYVTLNGTVTSNGTLRTWWNGRDDEDESDTTESISDTEYYFEFVNGDGTGGSPVLAATPDLGSYGNDVDYPPVTRAVKAVAASDPITVAEIAYMLTPGATYYVRLCARRFLYPGSGNGERYRRENQPFKLFLTAPVTFTLPTT